jgi:hypothetical protein
MALFVISAVPVSTEVLGREFAFSCPGSGRVALRAVGIDANNLTDVRKCGIGAFALVDCQCSKSEVLRRVSDLRLDQRWRRGQQRAWHLSISARASRGRWMVQI